MWTRVPLWTRILHEYHYHYWTARLNGGSATAQRRVEQIDVALRLRVVPPGRERGGGVLARRDLRCEQKV